MSFSIILKGKEVKITINILYIYIYNKQYEKKYVVS